MQKTFLTELVGNLHRPLIILDTKTTGINLTRDKIVELSLLKYFPAMEKTRILFRFNPQTPLSPSLAKTYNLEKVDLSKRPTFPQKANELFRQLHDCDFCGINISFGLMFIQNEMKASGIDFDTSDSLKIDPINLWKNMEPRNMEMALGRFFDDNDINQRKELTGSDLALQVLLGQMEEYKIPADLNFLSNLSARQEDVHVELLTQKVSELSSELTKMKLSNIQFKFDLALNLTHSEKDFYKKLNDFGVYHEQKEGQFILSSEGIRAAVKSKDLAHPEFNFSFNPQVNIGQQRDKNG